jgi:hypothetical protein
MKSGSKIELGEETYKAFALKHTNLGRNTRAKLVEVRQQKLFLELDSINTTNAVQKYGLYFGHIYF